MVVGAAGNHARITEQLTGMGLEAHGELIGVARADLVTAHAGLRAATGRHPAAPTPPQPNGQPARTRKSPLASAWLDLP
jgi:hypothetical protein